MVKIFPINLESLIAQEFADKRLVFLRGNPFLESFENSSHIPRQ